MTTLKLSPVAKMVTLKTSLTMVVSKHWPLVTLDVKNAFLHGDPFEEVYTDMLLGYKQCATFQGEKWFVNFISQSTA